MLCSDEQRLQLYALYKQATVGACASPAPSRLDFVAHAKWCEPQASVGPYLLERKLRHARRLNRRSWQQVAALTKQSAMTAYISLVSELTGHQVRFPCGGLLQPMLETRFACYETLTHA